MKAVVDLDVEGAAAPPRSNGELVFAEPWEGRAFGLAVALADTGLFTWDEFRERLVEHIAVWESAGAGFRYYRCWLEALEALTAGHVSTVDLGHRAAHLAERPVGHDH